MKLFNGITAPYKQYILYHPSYTCSITLAATFSSSTMTHTPSSKAEVRPNESASQVRLSYTSDDDGNESNIDEFKAPQQDAGRDLVSLTCSILEDNPHIVDVSLQFQNNPISVDWAKTIFDAALTRLRTPMMYEKKAVLMMYWDNDGKCDCINYLMTSGLIWVLYHCSNTATWL